MRVRLADLEPDDPAWDDAFEVLVQLRTHLDAASFDRIHRLGRDQGLTYTAALGDGDRCVGIAGWRVMDTTSSIRKLYVEDLVVDADHRSLGVGRELLDHLEQRARAAGCHTVELDSGRQRVDAHRFYRRLGYEDVSRHFRRPLAE
jgi:GNAT superfamily N-acetyltransferase